MAKNIPLSDLKKAIIGSGGIMTTIAKRLKVDWHTAKRYIGLSEEATQLYEDETDTVLDMVEGKLLSNIKDGDTTSMIFYLKTKGKSRGYVERRENSNTNNTTIEYKDVSKG